MHCPLVVGINNHGVECLESGDLTRAMDCFRIALSQLRLHLDTFSSSSTSNLEVRTAASSSINKTRLHQGNDTTSAATTTPMIRPLPPNTEIETSFLFPFGPSSSATLSFQALHNNGAGGSSSLTPSLPPGGTSDVNNYKKTTLLFCRGLRLVDSTGAKKPCFSNDPLHEELLCSSLVMFNLALAYHLHGVLLVGQSQPFQSSQTQGTEAVHQRRMNNQHSPSDKFGEKSSSSLYSSNEMLIEAKELYRTAYEQLVYVMGEIDEREQQSQKMQSSSSPLSGLAGINALLDLLVMAVGNNFAQLLLIMQERGGKANINDDIMDFEGDDESMENEGDDHSFSSSSSAGDDTTVEDCDDDDDEDMIRELYSQVVQLAVSIQSSSSLMMDHNSNDSMSMGASNQDERRLFAMLHHTANGFLFNAVLAGLYPPNGAPAA